MTLFNKISAIAIAASACTYETQSWVDQAITPPAHKVLPGADSAAKYATACGLGDTPDLDLPALGTADEPIRGIADDKQVGKLKSNKWTLVQHFASDSRCLASADALKANLWHKTDGGREWYYLYRFQDSDPTKAQRTLNGVLGFDEKTICAYDKIMDGRPPAKLDNLHYAGELDAQPEMDDCSDCHVSGYNAPRMKTLAVAKGNVGNKFPYLKVKWMEQWQVYAAAYGPQWLLGKAVTNDLWVSGGGTALVTPPEECQSCHGDKWVPARNRDRGFYCDSVFGPAFDMNGSMTKSKNKFLDNATCKKFIDDIGCGAGRPGGATNHATTLCPPAARFAGGPPAARELMPLPMVNDGRMRIAAVVPVDSTTVRVIPAHDPDVMWQVGEDSAIGDPWAHTIQVLGAPYPGSVMTPMGPPMPVFDPEVLPPYIEITGLIPGQSYQLQLQLDDTDGTYAFEPTFLYTSAPPPPPPPPPPVCDVLGLFGVRACPIDLPPAGAR